MAKKVGQKIVVELNREEVSQLVGILGQMCGPQLDELWYLLLKEVTTEERWAWEIINAETRELVSYEMREAEEVTE